LGFSRSRLDVRRFRSVPAVSSHRHPPRFSSRVHPLVRFRSLQSLSSAAGPAKPGAFHGLPRPHRDFNRRSPRSRASQARFVPPSTFRTSSTVCSSSGLAGLFHPAAAYRVRSSGVSPREKRYGLVARRCPPVVSALSLPAVAHWLQDLAFAFRALFLSRIRRRRRWVRSPSARAPPELSPPSGFPSRTVKSTFIDLSDHGLSRPPSSRPCATCLALASLAPRSRFVA
jgi:hypothetical protein